MNESEENQIKEHMEEFSKNLEEYKKINEKNGELVELMDGLPIERMVEVMGVVGEIIILSVEATVKAVKESEKIAESHD